MPLQLWTQDDWLSFFRKLLPEDYVSDLETVGDGEGFDLPSAFAAIAAKVDCAINRSTQASYLLSHSTQTDVPAGFATKASGSVSVRRAPPCLGAITIPAGQRIRATMQDSMGGTAQLGVLVVTEALTLASGDSTTHSLNVAAELTGYTGNIDAAGVSLEFEEQGRATVRALVTSSTTIQESKPARGASQWDTFDGAEGRWIKVVELDTALATSDGFAPRLVTKAETDPTDGTIEITVSPALAVGDVGTILQVELEELSDFGLELSISVAISGGVADGLREIGSQRKMDPQDGESAADFRDRVSRLPDVVSPGAIHRICARILDAQGIRWTLLETRNTQELQGFVVGRNAVGRGGLHPDDTKSEDAEDIGQGVVILGQSTGNHFFAVLVSSPHGGDYSWAVGGPADMLRPPVVGLGVVGGREVTWYRTIRALWSELQGARGGGVGFQIRIDRDL